MRVFSHFHAGYYQTLGPSFCDSAAISYILSLSKIQPFLNFARLSLFMSNKNLLF